ncbi:hypothetical protein OfM1_11700 [Lactovum odontotermitis]
MEKKNRLAIMLVLIVLIIGVVAIYLLWQSILTLVKTQNGAIIFGALLTALVTMVTLFYNKRKELQLEREQYLYEERMKAYQNFYNLFFKFFGNEQKETPKPTYEEMIGLKQQLMMWASGPTIRSFEKSIMHVNQADPMEAMFDMESFLIQMRKDLGNNTAKPGEIIPLIINNEKDINRYRDFIKLKSRSNT